MKEIRKNNLAGIVVFYNPTSSMVDNLLTYIDGVDKLFIIDNSERDNSDLLVDKLLLENKIEYVWLESNLGIAKALNEGARRALEFGYDWILTFDQDSRFSSQNIDSMLSVYQTLKDTAQIGIIAASPNCFVSTFESKKIEEWEFVEVVITSGNIVNLKAWKDAGGWNEELFIDSVDTDFNYMIMQKGYKILRCNKVVFQHSLGDTRIFSLFGHKVFSVSNHSYIRRYYITRNRLYILSKYGKEFPAFLKKEKYANIKEFIKIILFEKDKIKKVRSVVRGYKDYNKRMFGKYRW